MAKTLTEQKRDIFSFSRFDIVFDNENSEVNQILQETVLTLTQSEITFELGVENGKIEPLTTLSKLIKNRNLDLKIKAYDSSKNNVTGEFILEKCRFLSIKNPLKFLNFSRINDSKNMDRITIEYTFERLSFNNLVMYEMPNPLEQLKSDIKEDGYGKKMSKKAMYEEEGDYKEMEAEEKEAFPMDGAAIPFFGGFTVAGVGRGQIYAEESADRAAFLSHGGEMVEGEMING